MDRRSQLGAWHLMGIRCLALVGALMAVPVVGAEEAKPVEEQPTRKAAVLKETVVVATQSDLPVEKLTKSVSVVTSEQIDRRHIGMAVEALRNVPGVIIRRTGGPGRLAAAQIRGSTDDQVLVLIDGVQADQSTSGTPDLGILTTDSIERIEVLRGGASTLYGSKAIGGVISITTKRGQGKPSAGYAQEFGTLRTGREAVTAQGEVGPIRFHTGATRFDSSGLSAGDGVHLTQATAAGDWQVAEWLSAGAALNTVHSWTGIDDGAFRPDPNRFIERDVLTLSTNVKARTTEWWEQEAVFGLNDDDFLDIDVGNPGTTQATAKSRFNTTRFSGDWLHRLEFDRVGRTVTGFNIRDDEGETSGFSKTLFMWAWFAQHQLDVTDRLTTIAGVRLQRHNVYGRNTTSEVSASYRVPVTETRLRANISQGFRGPDLNDLYFPNFGTPTLNPEKSWTYELGGAQDWLDDRLGAELTWFHTEVDDLIQSVRIGTTFRAQNVAEAQMQGLEFIWHATPVPSLRLSGDWTYVDADQEQPVRDELVRVPQYTLGWNVDYDITKKWALSLSALMVGHQEDSSRDRVKRYTRVDTSLTYQMTDQFQVYGRIENLFDRRYYETLGFPAPGTLFFLGGKVEI